MSKPEIPEKEARTLKLHFDLTRAANRQEALKREMARGYDGKIRALRKAATQVSDAIETRQVEMFDPETVLSPEVEKLLGSGGADL